jgi:hypothetical protein
MAGAPSLPFNSTPLEALLNQISYKGFRIVAHPFRYQVGYLEKWVSRLKFFAWEGRNPNAFWRVLNLEGSKRLLRIALNMANKSLMDKFLVVL